MSADPYFEAVAQLHKYTADGYGQFCNPHVALALKWRVAVEALKKVHARECEADCLDDVYGCDCAEQWARAALEAIGASPQN